MLTATAPPSLTSCGLHLGPGRRESHGSAPAWQARPHHWRLQGHRRGRAEASPPKASTCLAARNGGPLTALAEGLSARHGVARRHVVDLRNGEDLARLAEDSADIDILVNNAGDIPPGDIGEIDEATWRHAWELKVFGYINLTPLSTPR